MEPKDTPRKVEEQGQSKLIVSNNKLRKLKSDYFIQKFFEYMTERKSLETIRYNKSIQKRRGININHYKDYFETKTSIELDIIPLKGEYGYFININEEDKNYFHIYFNNNKKKEIEKMSLNIDDNISKISIIIDYQIKSFSGLFAYCKCIESIIFKKFYRNNVTDMSYMFYGCSSLKELNLNNFNTNNVKDMSAMFYRCSSLKELNLTNFNTNNVTYLSYMFSGCLDELKLKIKSQFKNFKEEAFKN